MNDATSNKTTAIRIKVRKNPSPSQSYIVDTPTPAKIHDEQEQHKCVHSTYPDYFDTKGISALSYVRNVLLLISIISVIILLATNGSLSAQFSTPNENPWSKCLSLQEYGKYIGAINEDEEFCSTELASRPDTQAQLKQYVEKREEELAQQWQHLSTTYDEIRIRLALLGIDIDTINRPDIISPDEITKISADIHAAAQQESERRQKMELLMQHQRFSVIISGHNEHSSLMLTPAYINNRPTLPDSREGILFLEQSVIASPFGQKNFTNNPILNWQILSPQEFVSQGDIRTLASPSETTLYPIIGSEQADRYIANKAIAAGYKHRIVRQQHTELVHIGTEKLPHDVAKAWEALRNAAAKDGIKLTLTSGYRSPDTQRELFLTKLTLEAKKLGLGPVTSLAITSGKLDTAITNVLKFTATPGFSKHHSGYAIDVSMEGINLTDFGNTPGYRWLSANNYYNAKRFGFVPSYPNSTIDFGPEPEAWEYIYVGTNSLAVIN